MLMPPAVQMAFLMAASASLEGADHSKHSDRDRESSLNMAMHLLSCCKKAAKAMADRHESLGAPASKREDKSQIYMLIMVCSFCRKPFSVSQAASYAQLNMNDHSYSDCDCKQ